jgi:hypothetical protein
MRALGAIADQEVTFPAEMLFCGRCRLAQLGYAVPSEVLFPPDYPYTSGTTKILRDNFAQLYDEVQSQLKLTGDDLVVDIGSNDGTLLENFSSHGHRVIGIEPSLAARLAEERGITSLMRFFDQEAVDEVRKRYGQARVVTATNVFAHILDVTGTLQRIGQLTGDSGVFISESHYLRDLVETLQYDTIYHEHLRYYSLTSLKFLLAREGFTAFHATRIPTHGGSIRVYATRNRAVEVQASIQKLLDEESQSGITDESWIPDFHRRVVRSKLELYEQLARISREGGRIYGIGAPSRASTLINYVGLDDGILDCVLEVPGSKKLNKFVPGTAIPIVDETRLYTDQPTFALLLSWHIADELCANLKKKGYRGDFIVPLPEPRIIRNLQVSSGRG